MAQKAETFSEHDVARWLVDVCAPPPLVRALQGLCGTDIIELLDTMG